MGNEVDLLINYPRSRRNVKERGSKKTRHDQEVARRFGKEFFDGNRKHGYGGFFYNERFWTPVVPAFRDYYALDASTRLLDIGCAKGFMLYDFIRLIPGMSAQGIDVSEYAINNALPDVKNMIQVSDARELPFANNSYDLVVSINTIHNLDREGVITALKEIQRVSAKSAFVTVDAYRNAREKKAMLDWNLTARTILSVDEWKALFAEAQYTGDYYWFMP
jgi:SAM-dependent methyltransferase